MKVPRFQPVVLGPEPGPVDLFLILRSISVLRPGMQAQPMPKLRKWTCTVLYSSPLLTQPFLLSMNLRQCVHHWQMHANFHVIFFSSFNNNRTQLVETCSITCSRICYSPSLSNRRWRREEGLSYKRTSSNVSQKKISHIFSQIKNF